MKATIPCILAFMLLSGCAIQQSENSDLKTEPSRDSRFHGLKLQTGMKREEIEKQVAELLDGSSKHSPYGNNLKGGIVQYRDGDWILEVKYKAGAPAPWVENADGTKQHCLPVDETLLEYVILRIPNPE